MDAPGLEPPPPGASVTEIERRYLRIHMLHQHLEIHERFLLHPRILDVLEALIGPDVMAMQTMLFFKSPGGAGQGYHQDSYYIPTYPDTLCGAWLALERADEENGCVWFTGGTQHEPIHPSADRLTQNHANLALTPVEHVSHTDTEVNTLSRIAARYPGREMPAIAEPGDVVFFAGHIPPLAHQSFPGSLPPGLRQPLRQRPARSRCGAARTGSGRRMIGIFWPVGGRTCRLGCPGRHTLRGQRAAARCRPTG